MRRFGRLLLPAVLAGLASCVPPRGAAPDGAPARSGTVVRDTVRSAALRGNPLGDSPARAVEVYLPPSYAIRPGRRYPVVYLLHGFDGDPSQWRGRMRVPEAMDSLSAAGSAREMIVVMPDGKNALGGSFFANTAAMGRWEDFAARELVRYVDRRYRTLARAESRAVAGWSMGGWAALHLAAGNPEVFGAVYALSPCCMGHLFADVGPSASGWDAAASLRTVGEASAAPFGVRLRLAVAGLVSPDASRPLGVALPFRRTEAGIVPDEPAHAAWRAASPDSLVARHRTGLARLRGIGFDAGEQDGFRHIPASARALSAALGRAGIPHRYEAYPGTHGDRVPERLRTVVLPFLSERLAAQPARR